jgi:uncharacterized protein YjiS (DUF1127 family)
MLTLHIPTLSIAFPALPKLVRSHLPHPLAMLRAVATRRDLAAMDDRMLSDIGLSRVDALREAERLPWDLDAEG